ncbi:hypothetical protein BLNAU_17698 [Blattamonas nauphoetae]|uniref:Uncharacterized protein n=1 Tax=Blattamonas nauphoetae TaxID=2049346 RepID=A0ABQ9X6G8_9EUKA|nr:hypothetical protein BLNAU_17698 [Blattamonas nauphoetae]
MISHPTTGNPIEASDLSNDFYKDFRQLVSSVDALKEQNAILRKRVDHLESDLETSKQTILIQQTQINLQNEKLVQSKSDVENLHRTATTTSTNQLVHLFNRIESEIPNRGCQHSSQY